MWQKTRHALWPGSAAECGTKFHQAPLIGTVNVLHGQSGFWTSDHPIGVIGPNQYTEQALKWPGSLVGPGHNIG